MNNLEQVRARHALEYWKNAPTSEGKNGGDVVSGLSATIINNGLLSMISFAIDKKGGHLRLINNICQYLSQERKIFNVTLTSDNSGITYLDTLSNVSSIALQQATDEALAYLTYLKRLKPAEGQKDE
ncbi:MAG: hypothetical protein JW739_08210 [Opitutales bacterium]|nr:hypothetical protein [Opitutales bacterium]